MREDPRIAEAHKRSIENVADLLHIDKLRRASGELVGPCPVCGGHEKRDSDRFSIAPAKGIFNCRKCGVGGDQIRLVEFVRGCSFLEALDWLCGPRPELSAEEMAARQERSEKDEAARQAREAQERDKAARMAFELWEQGRAAEGTPVAEYLARRGIGADRLPRLPRDLRYHPALRYTVPEGRGWTVIHEGPAMLAAIRRPDGQITGVHRTWLDLAQPKGKARLIGADGAVLDAKKMLGSKKGGAIRLHSPRGFTRLVIGEGIETTLTALVARRWTEATAFWAAGDLGNIAGQMMRGKGLKYAGLPDMADARAFVPPPWVSELILLMDGDSEPRDTRAKLLSGARRAMLRVPGLRAQIVPCPDGADLNDVLMEEV